jgi:hypothetical protein
MGILAESVMDFVGAGKTRPQPAGIHLRAAMQWLCRAQDAGDDDGVARMYSLRDGWGASYPETTGYIIPTFMHYARFTGDTTYRDRALRMADWEVRVQMPEGAVQGGTIAHEPSPAIFNTGQVLFGWSAALNETGDPAYRKALAAAANYLVTMQDSDFLWRRNLSRFCGAPVDTYAYNVRSAWALLIAAELLSDPRARAAAEGNIEAVCQMAQDNGWVQNNCLNKPEQPLLHTIAYTFQGLFEGGLLADNRKAVDIAVRGNERLRAAFEQTGTLLGRYDAVWRPTVKWRCLTGEAQTAIVWFRLAEWTGDKAWSAAARALTGELKRLQRLEGDPDTVGALKGAFPVYGEYGKYEYLNWATKFMADALMQEAGYEIAGTAG